MNSLLIGSSTPIHFPNIRNIKYFSNPSSFLSPSKIILSISKHPPDFHRLNTSCLPLSLTIVLCHPLLISCSNSEIKIGLCSARVNLPLSHPQAPQRPAPAPDSRVSAHSRSHSDAPSSQLLPYPTNIPILIPITRELEFPISLFRLQIHLAPLPTFCKPGAA